MADRLFSCHGKVGSVDISYITCPKCGEEIEVFSDEEEVVCECGEVIKLNK